MQMQYPSSVKNRCRQAALKYGILSALCAGFLLSLSLIQGAQPAASEPAAQSPAAVASPVAARRIGIVPLSCEACSDQLKAYAKGTQDNLIDGLGRVPTLVVVDRTRMEEVIKELAFQESAYVKPESALKVGEILGVEYLYTGSLQQAGDELRILIQQLDVASGESKPLGKVTGGVQQLFGLQDQLVGQILAYHGLTLAPAAQQALQQQLTLTDKPEAYAAYVQAIGSEDAEVPAPAALASLDQAISLDPDFGEAYHRRALIMIKRRDFGRARADLDKAISLNPNDGRLYHARGRLLLEIGQPQAGLPDLDRAVQLQPGLAQAWNSRGLIKLALRQPAEARQDFDHALSLEPAYYMALINRAESAVVGQDFSAAEHDLARAQQLAPRRPAAFAVRGQLLEARGQCREAQQAWEQACRLGQRKLCRHRCQEPGRIRQPLDKPPRNR